MTGNIAKWIEKIAGDEAIEAVVIGEHDRGARPDDPINRVITWKEARPILDYDFESNYGSAGCHPVFAWTATKIITIHEYDGETGPTWYPRHPVDVRPYFDGVLEDWA